jgi:hypothetical protein
MAITARTAGECFTRFKDHVGPLVDKLVPTNCIIQCPKLTKQDELRTLRFVNPEHRNAVPLESEHGRLYLYLAQELRAEQQEGGLFRLRTVKYWYKIYDRSPAEQDDAIIRWEYEAQQTPWNRHSRHHVQFGQMVPSIPLGNSRANAFNLTRLHMPTGWVLMEEVFRFLIHDLGVVPPCGSEWPQVIHESEDAFYSGFTSRGGRGTLPP